MGVGVPHQGQPCRKGEHDHDGDDDGRPERSCHGCRFLPEKAAHLDLHASETAGCAASHLPYSPWRFLYCQRPLARIAGISSLVPAAQGHGTEVCGGSSTNPVFWVMVALTGVATGLPGHPNDGDPARQAAPPVRLPRRKPPVRDRACPSRPAGEFPAHRRRVRRGRFSGALLRWALLAGPLTALIRLGATASSAGCPTIGLPHCMLALFALKPPGRQVGWPQRVPRLSRRESSAARSLRAASSAIGWRAG